MSIKEILRITIEKLKENNIKNPHLDAEILLSHVLNKTREYILTYPEKKITKIQATKYKLLITRRTKGKPIAYIIEHKAFYGLDFFVNKNVLVPRPETELMVDEAIRLVTCNLPAQSGSASGGEPGTAKNVIIDVGTGSGCIINSIAVELIKKQYPISNIQFFAIDISKKALSVARKNSKNLKLNKKIKFLNGDLLKPIINKIKTEKKYNNIIITANLPYLTLNQLKNEESIQAEPSLALVAGKDGLKYYKKLLMQIKDLCKSVKACSVSVLLEIDPFQAKKLKKIIKENFKNSEIEIKKDLAGLNRVIKIII